MTAEGRKAGIRDRRFVAEHRGGPLRKEQHRQLMAWAIDCAKHVLSLFEKPLDHRLSSALAVAKEWEHGRASVGDARKASLQAIRVAQEASDPTEIAVARSVGHAVATAHMAEHSLWAASYALKAVENSGRSIEGERKWQDGELPLEVRDLVLNVRQKRDI
jgi:hypothetical protein